MSALPESSASVLRKYGLFIQYRHPQLNSGATLKGIDRFLLDKRHGTASPSITAEDQG